MRKNKTHDSIFPEKLVGKLFIQQRTLRVEGGSGRPRNFLTILLILNVFKKHHSFSLPPRPDAMHRGVKWKAGMAPKNTFFAAMKKWTWLLLFLGMSFTAVGVPKLINKCYVYWEWNRGWFTNSDLHLKGSNYDFTIHSMVAKDRPTPFKFNVYFNPKLVSIPQFNFRFGYFIRPKYNISIGFDHMKYVMVQNQVADVDGTISNTGTAYDRTYSHEKMELKTDFLKFEHTNGLNYINVELRRSDDLFKKGKITFNLNEGVGTGILLPRTDATILGFKRHDELHVAGFGVAGMIAAQVVFYHRFFIQSEIKAGYINMPDIRTTYSKSDHADQHFLFTQWNWTFGVYLNTKQKVYTVDELKL